MVYFFAVLSFLAVYIVNGMNQGSCVVKFDSSSYGVGIRNETFSNVSYCIYLGVRYANPPTGSFRFKVCKVDISLYFFIIRKNVSFLQNPVLHDPVGPQNYTVAANICPQRKDINKAEHIIGDEDCLFMNIYTPYAITNGSFSNTKYPVLVYIHGGSFMAGSALTDVENGPDLLIDSVK